MAQPTRRTRTKPAPAAPEPEQPPKKARPTIDLPADTRSYEETEVTAMIQPAVRDKWLGLSNRSYDLKQVKSILDGTNSNRLVHMMSLFEVMEDTWPRLGKSSHEIRTSVTKLDFHFEAFAERGSKPTAEAQARAAFVEDVIRGMKGDAISGVGNFEQMLYDILDAYGKGVAVLEPQWVKAKDGTFRLKGTRWLRPVHFDYPAVTSDSERLLLSPDGQKQADVEFPADRFLVSVYRSRSAATANLVGIYRKLAPWWLFANFSTDWLMQYGQLFGVPIRWATYPESNKGQLATISSMLKKMGAAGWGAFPEGTNLNLVESKGSATQIPQVIIMEKAEEMCDLLLLGQTLTTKPGANGNRSLGDVHADVRNDRVQQCGEFACDVVSDQLIPAVLRWNYGNADMAPRMKIAADESAEAQSKVDRDKVLFFDMGLPVAKDYLYKRHNVPMPESTDDLYDKPEPPAPALGAGPAGPGGNGKPGSVPAKKPTKVAALGSLSVMDRRNVFDVSALDNPDTLIPREHVAACDLATAFDPDALAQAVEAARRLTPDDGMAVAALLDRVKTNHVLVVAGKGQEESLGLVAHAMRCGPQYKVPVLDLTGPIMLDTVAAGDEAGAPIPADVVEALAKMPEEARDYYVERLAGAGVDVSALDSGATATALLDRHAMASGRGGKFKSRAIAAAQAKVRAVLDGKPAFGGQRGHRRIHDFGMPDTAGQWQAVGGQLRHDSIIASAARVRKATEVPIDTLHPTQRTVDGEKLIDMMEGGDMAQPTHRLPIVVRKDGRDWLYDGHHRGVMAKLAGKDKLRCRVVDLGGVAAKEPGDDADVRAYDPDQPRDPGGKDGGRWVKKGASESSGLQDEASSERLASPAGKVPGGDKNMTTEDAVKAAKAEADSLRDATNQADRRMRKAFELIPDDGELNDVQQAELDGIVADYEQAKQKSDAAYRHYMQVATTQQLADARKEAEAALERQSAALRSLAEKDKRPLPERQTDKEDPLDPGGHDPRH